MGDHTGADASDPARALRDSVRITKYIHSCLLFEHEGEKLLFDPGAYSFIEGRLTPETFRDVSTVVITHNHPDHLDLASLKQILALSGADVITNNEVAAQLRDEGIDATTVEDGTHTAGAFTLRAIPTPHEAILSDTLPRHTAFLVNEQVLNCGDSFGEPLLPHAPSADHPCPRWRGHRLLLASASRQLPQEL
jgi:L-ascorbate metabolism protein UlaG (beta-lactamase superfamily)